MNWIDKRPLAYLNFGMEASAAAGALAVHIVGCDVCSSRTPNQTSIQDCQEGTKLRDEQIAAAVPVAARVREILACCQAIMADDIVQLGCTGIVAHGFSLDDAKLVRIGVGGSGVGLPCFVSPDRFCHVHQTIGGLQEGQTPYFAEKVGEISRDLTAEEGFRYGLTERVRRVTADTGAARIAKAKEMLSGRDLPEDLRAGDEGPGAPNAGRGGYNDDVEDDWSCPEHAETVWACRYCVAAEIVKGPLVPRYEIEGTDVQRPISSNKPIGADEIGDYIADMNAAGAADIRLLVEVATWTRKLAR